MIYILGFFLLFLEIGDIITTNICLKKGSCKEKNILLRKLNCNFFINFFKIFIGLFFLFFIIPITINSNQSFPINFLLVVLFFLDFIILFVVINNLLHLRNKVI